MIGDSYPVAGLRIIKNIMASSGMIQQETILFQNCDNLLWGKGWKFRNEL